MRVSRADRRLRILRCWREGEPLPGLMGRMEERGGLLGCNDRDAVGLCGWWKGNQEKITHNGPWVVIAKRAVGPCAPRSRVPSQGKLRCSDRNYAMQGGFSRGRRAFVPCSYSYHSPRTARQQDSPGPGPGRVCTTCWPARC